MNMYELRIAGEKDAYLQTLNEVGWSKFRQNSRGKGLQNDCLEMAVSGNGNK